MGAGAWPFFSFIGLSKPDSFIFDPFFTNPTCTQNSTGEGAGAIFHPILFFNGSSF
jgi:hypothetical protein